MNKKTIIVTGGGPAGMMAAITAGTKRRAPVALLEKNRSLGKKLLLTGNTHCNLTNRRDLEDFLAKYPKNGPFLRDSFKHFFNKDLIDFFARRGLKCKTEQDEKVFPLEENASGILEILKAELIKNGVSIFCGSPVQNILSENNRVSGIKLKNGKIIPCDRVILATGGVSYPATGSTGDGLKIAEELGHTITPLRPGLVPLVVKENYPSLLKGLSLKNVALKIFREGKQTGSAGKGGIVFTSGGISGPLVLSASGTVSDLLEKKAAVKISIDLFPETPDKKLRSLFKTRFSKHASKTIKNTMSSLIPQRLSILFLEITRIDKKKTSNQLTQKDLSSLVSICKNFPLTVTRTSGINEAMITRGGISLKEIDPRTMASHLIRNLYFAGEIIDIDGHSGGYNLQAAFSTGYLAGLSAAG